MLVAVEYPSGFLIPPWESKVLMHVVLLYHAQITTHTYGGMWNVHGYCGTRWSILVKTRRTIVSCLEWLSSFLAIALDL